MFFFSLTGLYSSVPKAFVGVVVVLAIPGRAGRLISRARLSSSASAPDEGCHLSEVAHGHEEQGPHARVGCLSHP